MSLSAHAVVVSNGEVLLIQRDDLRIWTLPGGRVEADESLAQAAAREVYEEAGVQIALTRLVGIYSMPHWIGERHAVVFAATPIGGALRPQLGEAVDVRYFRAEDLPERMNWWHHQPIRDALAGLGSSAVWQQDVRWPADWVTPDEFYALRDQGPLPESLIHASWDAWCRKPLPGEQWSELTSAE